MCYGITQSLRYNAAFSYIQVRQALTGSCEVRAVAKKGLEVVIPLPQYPEQIGSQACSTRQSFLSRFYISVPS